MPEQFIDGEIVIPYNEWKMEGRNVAQYRKKKEADDFIRTNSHRKLERVRILTLALKDYYGVRLTDGHDADGKPLKSREAGDAN